MAKQELTTVQAGPLVYRSIHPQRPDAPRERRTKQSASSYARQVLNFNASWQELELLLAANFGRRDWWVTLTYDDDHLPADRSAAQKAFTNYIARLNRQLKKKGAELRYVYTTEEMPDEPGGKSRLHHHAVIGGEALSAEEIKTIWGRGYVHVDRFLDGSHDIYETRARYLVKERHPGVPGRKTGLRAWSASRNLKRPQAVTEEVPDGLTICPPAGAYVLDRREEVNAFGRFGYLKYLLPEPDAPPCISISYGVRLLTCPKKSDNNKTKTARKTEKGPRPTSRDPNPLNPPIVYTMGKTKVVLYSDFANIFSRAFLKSCIDAAA